MLAAYSAKSEKTSGIPAAVSHTALLRRMAFEVLKGYDSNTCDLLVTLT